MKLKAGSLKKINKIDKPLAKLIRKKERVQINKIRNEKEEDTTDTIKIQRITRDYHEQPYANKMDNLEEMDKFLEKVQSKTEPGKNRKYEQITSTEIESVI